MKCVILRGSRRPCIHKKPRLKISGPHWLIDCLRGNHDLFKVFEEKAKPLLLRRTSKFRSWKQRRKER